MPASRIFSASARKSIRSGAILTLSILVSFALPAVASGAATSQPNIIFLYTDDQAAWTIGALGNPDARTPNLDRLVREGAAFTNSFTVTPVCSPSRASLITSRYGTEVGITDYLTPPEGKELGLRPEFATWPDALRQAGYATALIGKWHLGNSDQFHPTNFGYELFTGFRHGGEESKDPLIEEAGVVSKVEGFTTEILTDRAIQFIRDQREGPFLLSQHYWAPHANQHTRLEDGDRTWLPLPEAVWKPFSRLDPRLPNPRYPQLDVPRAKRMMREYLASINGVDRNVGRILELLDELKIADRTVVVFTSDHGYNMAHHGIWHKGNGRWILTTNQGSRPNLWDTSLRVPTLVRWPGVVAAGRQLSETVTNLDWYPTLLAIAGCTPPEKSTIRGRDFSPLLKSDQSDWDDEIFAQYSLYHGDSAVLRAWRTPRWKLIRDFAEPSRDALYHLATDPAESSNLIDSEDVEIQAIRASLEKRLIQRMREIDDPALTAASDEK